MDHALLPEVERIVVLRANGLGDAIVAEPALAALRAAYPAATITLVTSPGVAALLAGRPHGVDEVLVGPRVPGVCVAGPEPDDPPEAVEAFCARMRGRRFDLAVQLHGGGGNANPLILRFGARTTVGSRAEGAPPLDRTVPWTSHQHDLLRFLEVVELAGAHPVRLRPHLAVTEADRAAAGEMLDAALLDGGLPDGGLDGERAGGPLVVLHPGASDPRRRWPPQRLGAVGAALAAGGARVVVAGGPGDDPLLDAIVEGLRGAPAAVVRPSLPALVGLLERADLLVGNDSGPRHLAEAVGTATVGVFTRANLVDVAPLFRARHRAHVSWTSACAVCGRDWFREPCDHRATVVGDVPVDEVLASAATLLQLPRPLAARA